MERKKNYVNYCKAHAIQELENMKGENRSVYACDLGYELTQGININGTATFSTYAAKEYIRFWWDEAGDVIEYQKFNYGQILHNPFEEPEAFHVCMIIEGVNTLLARCPFIDKYWNDEIILDRKTINTIIREIRKQDRIEL